MKGCTSRYGLLSLMIGKKLFYMEIFTCCCKGKLFPAKAFFVMEQGVSQFENT